MNISSMRLGLLAAVILSTVTSPASAVAGYGFIDLGSLVSGYSDARGINNAAQVVGFFRASSDPLHATLWDASDRGKGIAVTRLGTEDYDSGASGINNVGQVVGFMQFDGSSIPNAAIWNGTTATSLLPGGYHSSANGINDAGQIVGTSGPYGAALVWNGSTLTGLITAPLPGAFGTASAINSSGQIVGHAFEFNHNPEYSKAILWNGGISTGLPSFGGKGSAAYDINDAGQVVGYANYVAVGYRAVEPSHAVLWQEGIATDLGTLGGIVSQANAINESAQIVGSFYYLPNGNPFEGVTHAALWDGATAVDLNDLLQVGIKDAGWVLIEARDINDNGWIVGQAHNGLTGEFHAFLLTPPFPEPETYALFIAGLGLMGFMSRRRKNS